VFAHIFIPFIVILTASITVASVAVSHFSIDTTLSFLTMLVAISGSAAGVFYFILSREVKHSTSKQKTDLELERLKASLTASMSHELRTPLNSIIGFTGIILQEMSGDINERQRDQLQRVLVSAKKLLAIITDVINIARIDSGSAGTKLTMFFLDEVIREAVDEFQKINNHDFSRISFKLDVLNELKACADRKKLTQCILNILIYTVECTNIRNMLVTACKSKGQIKIMIGTLNQELNQRQLNNLADLLQSTGLEPGSDRESNIIRLNLIKRMVLELLDGSMTANTEPDDKTLLCLTFQANHK